MEGDSVVPARGRGLEVGSPKGAIRTALQVGLLNDGQTRLALQMADNRNLTVHTYKEAVAEAIFSHIPGYTQLMEDWLGEMRKSIGTR
ncbi:MAG: nucleotidyltransferase substrate binding protein [Candidatus Bipolaricaulota bacterium]|nr:nucleotidyltransferase substrate binding protein [Candidatus Bipolaricaulota bacterium]